MNNMRVIIMIILSGLFIFVGKQSWALQDHADNSNLNTTNNHNENNSITDQTEHNGGNATDSNNAEDEHGSGTHEAEIANALAVDEPPAWFGYVISGFALLFIAAIILGSAAIIIKGPEPPDPATEHHH